MFAMFGSSSMLLLLFFGFYFELTERKFLSNCKASCGFISCWVTKIVIKLARCRCDPPCDEVVPSRPDVVNGVVTAVVEVAGLSLCLATGRNLRSLRGVLGVPSRVGGLRRASALKRTPP